MQLNRIESYDAIQLILAHAERFDRRVATTLRALRDAPTKSCDEDWYPVYVLKNKEVFIK